MDDNLPRGPRGKYANWICSACRSRKIKCRLPSGQGEIRPSNTPRQWNEACERCRRLNLKCVVTSQSKQTRVPRKQAEYRKPVEGALTVPENHSSGDVNPSLFDGYYVRSPSATNSVPTPQHARPDTQESFRAMLTSANLMSTLLANESKFASSSSATCIAEQVPLTEMISNGLATLLDESLVWHRIYLPFLPTVLELRRQLAGTTDASSSTSLLFALLSLCAIDSPSSELYWHQDLRQRLQAYVSYHGQHFIFDPPVHRHSVYILHIVIAYRPTALVACQQSASAAVRGTTHIVLAYNIAKRCGLDKATSDLSSFKTEEGTAKNEVISKALDALLWCRTIHHSILVEGSIVKPLVELEHQLDCMHRALQAVHALLPTLSFSAGGLYLFYAMKCVLIEMQHYVWLRKARGDLAALADVLNAYEEASSLHMNEMLETLSRSEPHNASEEEIAAVSSLVPMERNQASARLFTVGLFLGVMSYATPSEPSNKIQPHEAVRTNKIVFEFLRGPNGKPLQEFLDRFIYIKDPIVQTVLKDFIDKTNNLKLQRMPWLPPARQSSQEILFQCYLIVDQDIGRLEAGLIAHPKIDLQLELLYQCAESMEKLSVPAGSSIDDAFAKGCHYAASAKLIRCLHGILLTRTSDPAAKSQTKISAAELSESIPGAADEVFTFTDDLDFDQVFGEWENWPYNSTWNMLQSFE